MGDCGDNATSDMYNYCTCSTGYSMSLDRSQCVKDCGANAYDSYGYCQCEDGFGLVLDACTTCGTGEVLSWGYCECDAENGYYEAMFDGCTLGCDEADGLVLFNYKFFANYSMTECWCNKMRNFTLTMNGCACLPGFTLANDTCFCLGYIDIDGSCVQNCTLISSDNTTCVLKC